MTLPTESIDLLIKKLEFIKDHFTSTFGACPEIVGFTSEHMAEEYGTIQTTLHVTDRSLSINEKYVISIFSNSQSVGVWENKEQLVFDFIKDI